MDKIDIPAIQEKAMREKIGDELYDTLDDMENKSKYIQPYHKGPEDRCPGCGVYKGQFHGEECKNVQLS